MGCASSSGMDCPVTEGALRAGHTSSIPKNISNFSSNSGQRLSKLQNMKNHERLRKLKELDEVTKIPFILVELRGLGNKNGYVEICGKDEYGVYDALDHFLTSTWGCKREECGDLSLDTPIPFCDAMYKWEGFRSIGSEGLSNMGLATMQIVDFMTKQLTWTLGVVNGGNVGVRGEIREQQIIFKAPHPMNMVAHHMMIEMRSAGFIEVCGDCKEVMDVLDVYLRKEFKARPVGGHEEFCDHYYKCDKGVFKERGGQGENNLGNLTTKICDAVVRECPGWSLTTLNGGNCGEDGTHREQQLVFRLDNHPLGQVPHMLVELRDAGYIEVNGQDVDGIYAELDRWLTQEWGCKAPSVEADMGAEKFFDRKYPWQARDMMLAAGDIIGFFHTLGWQMQVCSQGTVKVNGGEDSREQQILFRPGASGIGVCEPHLLVELYTGEGMPELYDDPEATQVLGNQLIRIYPIGDCSRALEEFRRFVVQDLGGAESESEKGDARFECDLFLSRGKTDNNLGCWTMRVCDLMVDRLGWSFVVCNVCSLGNCGQFREQQLVFRYDGERREIPIVRQNSKSLDLQRLRGLQLPSYWSIPDVVNLQKDQAVVPCSKQEITALQEQFDKTFKRVLTRDRIYEYQASSTEEMPYRLVVVHAFRSENSILWERYSQRYAEYARGDTPCKAKTRDAGDHLNARLQEGEGLLFHGTNPSSAMAILKSGFVLDNAGKSTGTMFGCGIYLAECASKSDEYAKDDGGGTYPQQFALLVCRSLIGQPHVVHDDGDYLQHAKDLGADCICGDRESKVNTYQEFVFWDERQVIPEYAVIYRREYDKSKVPDNMRMDTKGTTGRSWQVKLDKGFKNIPPNVNFQLLEAMRRGQMVVDATIADFEYVFDLSAKTQKNKSTGMVRELRQPLQIQRGTSSLHGGTAESLG